MKYLPTIFITIIFLGLCGCKHKSLSDLSGSMRDGVEGSEQYALKSNVSESVELKTSDVITPNMSCEKPERTTILVPEEKYHEILKIFGNYFFHSGMSEKKQRKFIYDLCDTYVFSTSPPSPAFIFAQKNTRPCQRPPSFSNIQSSIASRYSDPRRLSAVGTSAPYKNMNMKLLPHSKPCANVRLPTTVHRFQKSPPTAIPHPESSSSTRPENPPLHSSPPTSASLTLSHPIRSSAHSSSTPSATPSNRLPSGDIHEPNY